MWKRNKENKDTIFPVTIDKLEKLLVDKFNNNPNLKFSKYNINDKKVAVFFIDYQVEIDKIQQSLLQPLLNMDKKITNSTLLYELPLNSGSTSHTLQDVLEKLVIGEVFIYIELESEIVSFSMILKESRNIEKAETESLVLGPKISFTESLSKNMNIVRSRIISKDLVFEEVKIGHLSPRDVRLVYLKSIANEVDVNTMRQRLNELDVDEIEDTIVLKQFMEDSQTNLFPQFVETELPDRFTYNITRGKIGVLVENSPTAFIAPATLFSFLESTEDLYMRWQAGSFLRIMRFMAMIFSVLITPTYVAAVTYQYAIIPTQLLISIGQSRAAVPFPPIFEALLLEFLLELLREAGARLPTKVGQTMGIVGGIVIGQAAVEAGLTSNILIIVVAMSALSSFTTPSYLFGTTVRIIRFPLIVLAGILGLLGIAFGLCWLIIHMLRLTSLGRPYLAPLYPLQIKDFNKVFFRAPLNYSSRRAKTYRPKSIIRFNKKDAKQKRDIDE
ncbi:spore germination protein [Ornithinibacillus massiliensis]|uniref:Spore germination protein n=1 Tax=Ornithinibacillus massiliensis TaxID=1944633 RepID=A0ABS5ME38_9BACI|nr:spore germination protein [Ornithinibacillus massiliensis]MBS3680590.1 spore germination protein [Ornithinibacillus massiliensis]